MAYKKIGSIGKSIPGGELFLVNESGHTIFADGDVEGELVYKGPNVTLGYAYSKEDLSKGDERNGEYHTGDIAKRDSEGYYYIIGRKNRFLKLYGHRVGLDECENILKNEYKAMFACSGTDDKLSIYYTDDFDPRDIRLFLSQKTGIQISAFEAKRISEIPKNESGKIKYSELDSAS